ncbi:MAG: hypothetical protein KY443_06485 [Actinobacteria bacterium]|nr:hypothetical protein [Actinomycetota bacterium]
MTSEERPDAAPQEGTSAPAPKPSAPDAVAVDTPAADVVPDIDTEPAGPPPPDRRPRGLVVACVALFVVSVALGILTAVLASRLDREVATRDDVEETAGRFATALLTYHFQDLERSKQAVLELSTGNFRREYEQAFSGGLDVLITETKAASEGTVTDIFVSDVEDDTASAIVVADVRVTGTAGERRSASSYIQLELVRVAGRWRVDGVTNLNFGQNGTPTGVPSTPTTTTTAPPR